MIPIFDGARGQEINARNPRGMGGPILIRPAVQTGYVFPLDSLDSTYIDEANASTNFNSSTSSRIAYYDTAGGTGDEKQIVIQFPKIVMPRRFYLHFLGTNMVVRSLYNGLGSSNTATTRLRIDVTAITSFGSLAIDTITWNNKAGLTLGNSTINPLFRATGQSIASADATVNAWGQESSLGRILEVLSGIDSNNPPVGALIAINPVTIGQDSPASKYQKRFEVDSSNTLSANNGAWGERPMWVVVDHN